ncbi:hypothetical protein [Tenacibaculum sp. nBUS_03]|uniref:hypothetical protein n=1 Tax=Tenacibaculum sp. nBUS_03 TaxID=3395320 RepID=UPI003EB9B53B
MKKIALILIALIGISTSSYSQDKNAKRVRNYIENNKRKVILKESAVKLRPDRAFSQRLAPGGINVRGNMTFVANSIVNREYATTYTRSSGRIWIWNATCRFWYRDYTYTVSGNSLNANDSFPDTQTLYALTSTDSCGINYYSDINSLNNGQQNMQYIDIDDADGITGSGSTFSSSKSTLALPNCSKVVYAGLYWAAIYPYETWEGQEVRDSNFNTIKFKLPEGNYENITGEVIYDDGSATQKPYVCYKNITTEVAAQTNANGEYYAADIKAVTGNDSNGLGGAGGWTMVVIYENQNESSKNISIFDGFVTIDGSTNVDVTYSGFTTIPAGPVRAEFIVGTLEGDGGLGGDRFQIMDNSTPTPVPVDISNAVNPVDNFFNGSISRNGTLTTTRTPASANTLGFDVDILSISNPSNSIIGNGDTSADVRFTTSRDVYWPFLNAMSIEIIQPEIQMVKRVEDALGNDIAGTSLALGAELWYDVSFQNVGTDNALNTVFVDELPKNVDLIETDIILPSGIDRNDPSQFQYEPPSSGNGFRGKITINIPDDMVEEGGLEYHIRFKVQVVTDCNQLRDVCSNRIENQAYVNYEGDRGGAPRKTVKSYASFDACSFGVVGTSNFLVDTSGCKYERNEILCGANLTLTAGSGFAAYEWSDASGIIGSTQSIVVTTPGVYTVKTTATAGCIDTTEIITVIPYTSEPNPLIPFADRMLTCTNKDIDLAEIFLCGASGSRDINLPFDPASGTTVQWSKLDETSCSDVTAAGCPNEQSGCIWNPIGTAFTQNISDEGEYKVDVLYDGRCLTTYYFNVFKSILTPDIIKKDITCGNDGQIIINGIPAGYQYRLTGPSGYDVGFQNSNTFSALTNPGDYNLQIRINNPTAASCTYDFGPINIQDNDIDIDLIPTHIVCSGDIGKIRIQVNNVPGDYTYTLLQGGVVVGTPQGPISTNDYTFDVSTGGTYEVRVTTDDCSITENVIINQATDLTLTAATTKNISCTSGSSDGIITLTGNGGTLTSGSQYNYAVWTDKGTDLYTAISDIPASAYFTSNTYTVTNGDEGTYRFVIIDSNNCYTISNPVTVSVETPLTFNHSSTDISCTGQVDGSINVSVNGSNQGYLVEYSIDGGVNWDVSGNFPGLAVNTYTIDIRASKPSYLCTYSITNIQIQDKAPIVSSASLTQDFTCTTLGQITFTAATGGTLDYSYGINGVYNSDLEYNNLPVGTYALTVRDSENCEVTLPSIEIKPLPVIPNIPSSITYNCDGNGNITLTPPSTPALTYSYSLDGGIPQPGNVFNSVGARTTHNYCNCTACLPTKFSSKCSTE